MIEEASFTIVGERIADTALFLHRGWNLVGYNSSIARLRADALLSIEGLYVYIWTYDRSADEWRKYVVNGSQIDNNLFQLEPGRAYWIYVGQDCTWTLPSE